jgi:acyl-CoA-binding protein
MLDFKVPEPFLVPPFFEKDELMTIFTQGSIKEALQEQPLLFDMHDQLQLPSQVKPWEEKDEYIPILVQNWLETEPSINKLFEARNQKQVVIPMKKMILTFVAVLFWTNGSPVLSLKKLTNQVKELKTKPVNVEERIEFVISNPNHYHAFIQLRMLFSELQKKYAVLKLKENAQKG